MILKDYSLFAILSKTKVTKKTNNQIIKKIFRNDRFVAWFLHDIGIGAIKPDFMNATYSITYSKEHKTHLVYASFSEYMQYTGTKKECEQYIKHQTTGKI